MKKIREIIDITSETDNTVWKKEDEVHMQNVDGERLAKETCKSAEENSVAETRA